MSGPPVYGPAVARRFAAPGRPGPLPPGGGRVIRGEAGSQEEGTWVIVEARVAAQDPPRLGEVAFRVYGCPHTLAAVSLAAESLEGQPVGTLVALEPAVLARALEIPATKAGRLLVLQDALRNCFADWDNSRLSAGPG